MTDLSQLNGRELNEAIAKAMGWKQCGSYRPMCVGWYQEPHNRHSEHSMQKEPPDFITSLDALSDSEKVLIDAGYDQMVVNMHGAPTTASWQNGRTLQDLCGVHEGDTEALARARACLAALTALKEQETT